MNRCRDFVLLFERREPPVDKIYWQIWKKFPSMDISLEKINLSDRGKVSKRIFKVVAILALLWACCVQIILILWPVTWWPKWTTQRYLQASSEVPTAPPPFKWQHFKRSTTSPHLQPFSVSYDYVTMIYIFAQNFYFQFSAKRPLVNIHLLTNHRLKGCKIWSVTQVTHFITIPTYHCNGKTPSWSQVKDYLYK